LQHIPVVVVVVVDTAVVIIIIITFVVIIITVVNGRRLSLVLKMKRYRHVLVALPNVYLRWGWGSGVLLTASYLLLELDRHESSTHKPRYLPQQILFIVHLMTSTASKTPTPTPKKRIADMSKNRMIKQTPKKKQGSMIKEKPVLEKSQLTLDIKAGKSSVNPERKCNTVNSKTGHHSLEQIRPPKNTGQLLVVEPGRTYQTHNFHIEKSLLFYISSESYLHH
jgi:hypothetical protein